MDKDTKAFLDSFIESNAGPLASKIQEVTKLAEVLRRTGLSDEEALRKASEQLGLVERTSTPSPQRNPATDRIDSLVKTNDIVLFMKGNASFPQCGFSGRAIQILKAVGVDTKALKTVNVLEDDEIRQGIKGYSNWPTIPQLYVKGEFIGGSDIMMEMYESGELQQMLGAPA